LFQVDEQGDQMKMCYVRACRENLRHRTTATDAMRRHFNYT